jgi:protein-L-isoaspartate(D-aspartate) O-methyltransferase
MDFALARQNMIESQIRTNQVTDPRLLRALSSTPRELFLPVERRSVAYVDEDIRISENRFLLEPMVLARLLQTAELRDSDVALDIGCATGYSTAILAQVVGTVVGVESDAAMAKQAGETLGRLAIDAAIVVHGALTEGYPKHAPYDIILIGGAVAEVPRAILDQLAEDGRLVTIRRREREPGEGVVMLKKHGAVSGRGVFNASCPYLPGFAPQAGFVF